MIILFTVPDVTLRAFYCWFYMRCATFLTYAALFSSYLFYLIHFDMELDVAFTFTFVSPSVSRIFVPSRDASWKFAAVRPTQRRLLSKNIHTKLVPRYFLL